MDHADRDEKEAIFSLATLPSSRATTPHPPPPNLLPNAPTPIPAPITAHLHTRGFTVDPTTGLVRWSAASPSHPRNWPLRRKLYDTALIVLLEAVMTLVSNTGSSLAPFAGPQLGLSREGAVACFTTVYLLGQALGGLVFPPVAESFGGRAIYLTSTFGFALGCVLLAAAPGRLGVVVACRFVTGLLSAMPCVVATGSLENMWDFRSRTFVIHVWISAAVVGLALGPPVATFVSTSALGW